MSWPEEVVTECERQLRGVIEPYGFEYRGFTQFGRGVYCNWLRRLSLDTRLNLKVWWEWDGPVLLYSCLSLRMPRNAPPWYTVSTLYVNQYVRMRLGGQSATHVIADTGLREGYDEIRRQLEMALPNLDDMVEALRSRDPELLMR